MTGAIASSKCCIHQCTNGMLVLSNSSTHWIELLPQQLLHNKALPTQEACHLGQPALCGHCRWTGKTSLSLLQRVCSEEMHHNRHSHWKHSDYVTFQGFVHSKVDSNIRCYALSVQEREREREGGRERERERQKKKRNFRNWTATTEWLTILGKRV